MKLIFTLLLFCACSVKSVGQVQPLKRFDFSSGEYYLIGFSWGGDDGNALVEELGEWYTNDIDVLNEFKSKWKFVEPGKKYACGYHYEVHLCKDGQSVKEFLINLNCNEIVTDEGYFYFDTEKLSSLKDKLNKPIRKSKSFDSIDSARNYHQKVLRNDSLIWTPNPEWLIFEGSFSFNYECKDKNIDCLDNEEKILKELHQEISSKYPNEKFELDGGGGSNSDLFVDVNCNKSLADKFDLYLKGWNKWKANRLELGSYWIK